MTGIAHTTGADARLTGAGRILPLAPAIGVVLALVFAYREALTAMVRLWDVSPMYSYGFTVPFVSAYLLWTRRTALRALTPQPAWVPGSLVLLTGLAMTFAGRVAGILVLEQLAFLVSLTGIALVLFGTAHVRVGWAALAYLLLMVPLWDGFTESMHEPFQHRSAAIGIGAVRLLGIPAYRDGVFITLPNLQVEVARACSGVNYLVAVIALGLPLGYVFLRSVWRQVLLLVTAVVVAALSNGLRVALICTLAHYEIGSPLHGPFHMLHGLFVAGIGYVVLFAGLRILSRGEQSTTSQEAAGTSPANEAPRPSLVASAVLASMFIVIGTNVLAWPTQPVPLEAGLDALPTQLGEWTADPVSRAVRDAAPTEWPGADVQIARRYRRADGVVVDLYLGYFASQEQSRELVTHRSGDAHSRAVPTRVAGAGGGSFDANYLAPDKHGVSRMFWYDVGTQPETNRYVVKARTLWNSIRGAGTNGAVIVLSTRAPGAATPGRVLGEFAGVVQETVATRLPRTGLARK